MLEIEQLDTCPICGHEGNDPTYYATAPYGKENHVATLCYMFCEECHTIYLNPRMTDAQTRDYYSGEYRDTVTRKRKDEDADGISQSDLRIQAGRSQLQAQMTEQFTEDCKTSLEIGCSAGYLMSEFHARGMECIGVEPDKRYHKIDPAKNYTVYKDIADLPDQRFDLFAMSHSIEHLNHPLEYIRSLIDKHGHKGSRFIIEVPNTEYYQCFCIHHPFAFTPETLNGLFARAGCKALKNLTHGLDTRLVFRYLVGVYEVK